MEFELEYGLFWVAKSILPSWEGYLDRSGAYGGPGQQTVSQGKVDIVFAPEGRDTSPLTAEELALVQWFIDNELMVSATVKKAILAGYAELQRSFDFEPDEAADYMPNAVTEEDFKPLIGLYAVNVHQLSKDGVPYLGFEFGCTWDDEHGLGVLMHGTRLIELGDGDTARLLWIAQKDADASA